MELGELLEAETRQKVPIGRLNFSAPRVLLMSLGPQNFRRGSQNRVPPKRMSVNFLVIE